MAGDIERIKDELEEARHDLHRTVSEVNKKVESVSAKLQPLHLVQDHLLLCGFMAGGIGFAFGSRSHLSASLLLGVLLGAIAGGMVNGDS